MDDIINIKKTGKENNMKKATFTITFNNGYEMAVTTYSDCAMEANRMSMDKMVMYRLNHIGEIKKINHKFA
jgi:predicted secreted protein